VNPLGARALFDVAVAALDERVLASRDWVIHERSFPSLDIAFRNSARSELRVRLNCEDWNDTPPSVALLAPDGTFLTALPPMRPGSTIFNGSPHARTGRPFVCMVGTREYHEHESHVNDLWSNYKSAEGYKLGGIVERLWRGWWTFWP
jgi:hypothetical protein